MHWLVEYQIANSSRSDTILQGIAFFSGLSFLLIIVVVLFWSIYQWSVLPFDDSGSTVPDHRTLEMSLMEALD